ncbi:YbaK/EbsC family protein [Candidatus Uhrbacteria bacterium]|nr:YbaK/EbsC family protein [Candidatus Uhrbacteria bacterium]
MPMHKKVAALLERAKVPFEPITHRVVYTAYDTAQTLRAKVSDIAKPLLLKADKGFALAIVSAGQNLDLTKVAKSLKAKKIRIPTEKEIVAALKLNKKQGLSVFGSIYGIPVLLDRAFAKTQKAVFSAGSFTDSVKMKMKDFVKLESPTIGAFGVAKKFRKQKPQAKIKKKPTQRPIKKLKAKKKK